ncbi:MAG: oligosaccharide flippase family protein [Deltaproteobacteria bacterium]|nr:oligosaccharide flippase family protein [Deltaproteobacteria bacterium]
MDVSEIDSEIESDVAGATEVSRGRIVVNAVSNYVNLGFSLVLMLFLQAFLVRQLGRNQYALWPLAETCVGFLALIPLGVGSGAGRFLAFALADRKFEEVEQITSSLFFAMCAAAVLYAAGGTVLSLYFESVFDIPEGAAGIGPWVMFFMGLAGAVAMPFGVFEGGLVATQRYVALNVIRVTVIALRVAMVVVIFLVGYRSLVWLAVVNFVLAICGGVAAWLYARRHVPWQRVRVRGFNWTVLRKVTNYSGLTLLIAVAGLMYWKTDNIVINKLLDPSLLTAYAVVASFVLGIYQLVSRGTGVLMPAVTVLFARKDTDRIARLIYRANRILVPATVPVFLFLVAFGGEMLTLYIGPQYARYAVLFPILAASGIMSCTQTSSGSVPQGMGRLGVITAASMTWAVLNVILSIVFVTVFNLELVGVALGTALVTIFAKGGWQPAYIAHLLHRGWFDVFYNLILMPLGHCVPAGLIIVGLRATGWGHGWIGLGLVFTCLALFQAVYMVLVVIDANDRALVFRVLKGIFKPGTEG